MNIFILIPFSSFLAALFLGIYILSLNRDKELNQIYFVFTLFLAYYAFMEFGLRHATSIESARLWVTGYFLWPFMVASLLHFAIVYTERASRFPSSPLYLVVYAPAVLFSIVGFVKTATIARAYWGWTYTHSEHPIFSFSLLIWAFVASTASVLLCLWFFLRTADPVHRQQRKYVFLGTFAPVLFGILTLVVIPELGIAFPDMTTIGIVVGSALIGYAICKHDLFVLRPGAVTEDIVSIMPDALLLITVDARIAWVNPGAERMIGYDEEALGGRPIETLLPANGAEGSWSEIFCRLTKTDALTDATTRLKTKDGREVPISLAASTLRHENGTVQGYVLVARDLTERKRMEAELKEREAQYRLFADNTADVIWTMDMDLQTTYVSPSIENLRGYTPEEHLSQSLDQILTPSSFQTVIEIFAWEMGREEKDHGDAQRSDTFEVEYRCKNGSTIWAEINTGFIRDDSGRPIGLHGVARDISERKRQQEEMRAMEVHLRQQQKLESIGTLASGVAHEINNPINVIMNYAQIIEDRLEEERSLEPFTTGIREETERIANIVRNLLTFARDGGEHHRPARIEDIIDRAVSLFTATLREDRITLHIDIPDDLPLVRCRSQQIQQVLMNLLTNARDALNARYPGYDEDKIIRIGAQRIQKEDELWLTVTVEDHGCGIDDAIVDRIFDPFFTTRSRAEGTGLGLSVSHGIIEKHGGTLRVESELGEYTRFHLELPVDTGEREDRSPVKREE